MTQSWYGFRPLILRKNICQSVYANNSDPDCTFAATQAELLQHPDKEVFSAMASEWLSVSIEDVTSQQRDQAKKVLGPGLRTQAPPSLLCDIRPHYKCPICFKCWTTH